MLMVTVSSGSLTAFFATIVMILVRFLLPGAYWR